MSWQQGPPIASPLSVLLLVISHPQRWRWKVTKSTEASCVVMLEANVTLPSGMTPHTNISADIFSNLTGWSVCLGELIVFRWGNLSRGSGREDRSKGLREKSRKAEGYKLTMCRIFVSTWVLVRKLQTLYLFCVSGYLLTWPHTHTSAQTVLWCIF